MKYALNLWLILATVEMLRHVYIRKYKKKSPNKALSLTLRCIVAGAIFMLGDLIFGQVDRLWYMVAGAYLFGGNWIHDYGQNILLRLPLPYLNNTGPIDSFQKKFEWPAFVLKSIFVIITVGDYYFNY